MKKISYKVLGGLALLGFAALAFQNCGKAPSSEQTISSSSNFSESPVDELSVEAAKASLEFLASKGELITKDKSCVFAGASLAQGTQIVAYQNSAVPTGKNCVKETRICTNGTLSGNFRYTSCSVGAKKSCYFNGITIPHDGSLTGYKENFKDAVKSCTGETLKCNDGNLAGSVEFPLLKCDITQTKRSCLFDGQQYRHGEQMTGYASQNCQKLEMVCNDGFIAGASSYSLASCDKFDPKTCYLNSTAQNIPSGEILKAFKTNQVAASETCVGGELTCANGKFSGDNLLTWPSCKVALAAVVDPIPKKSCTFNGTKYSHGAEVSGFSKSILNFGETCSTFKKVMKCDDGAIANSEVYRYPTCTAAKEPKSCMLDNVALAHGSSVKAYSTKLVPHGQSCDNGFSALVKCTDGTLSDTSYKFRTCAAEVPKSCVVGAKTYAHGATAKLFMYDSLPYSRTCTPLSATCNNGSFGANTDKYYKYDSCTVQPPKSCTMFGRPLAHGQSVKGYVRSTSPSNINESCERSSVQIKCDNGALPMGAYTYFESCTTVTTTNASCSIDGKTIAHGEMIRLFANHTAVDCGIAGYLYCQNGSLPGSSFYKAATCTTRAGKSCVKDGVTYAHGSRRNVFMKYTSSCVSTTNQCYDGVWSNEDTLDKCPWN